MIKTESNLGMKPARYSPMNFFSQKQAALHPIHHRSKGFALVVTLSLMILLTIIAVGLLTLSSISLRSTSQTAYLSAARSNAHMALMLALGEIQKNTGADTRITARADVLSENNPPVVGVWKSWEGTNHESSGTAQGRPFSPGNYTTEKEKRFLGWLASGDPGTSTAPPDTSPGSNKVTLLGTQSVGSGADREKLQIHLAPTLASNGDQKGAYAWWVSGENQKIRLPKPYEPSADTSGRWTMNAKSHAVADPDAFGLNDLLDDPTPALKAITLKQSDLISNATSTLPTSREFFHDLSTSSIGLLTNTATGGWKKDLSLLTENWSSAGTRNLPLFRVEPGKDILGNFPTSSDPFASKSMLYPWSSYRGGAADPPIYRHGAVASWENLKDYVLAYRAKGISTQSNGRASISSVSESIVGNDFNFLHKVRVLPVIARIQWVFSHTAGTPPPPPAGQAAYPRGSLEPRLLVTPVITMWNPYNIELSFTRTPVYFSIPRPLPAALRYTVNGVQNTKYNCLNAGSLNNTPALSSSTSLVYQINSAFTLKPGETRVYSPSATAQPANTILKLEPGYRSRGGNYFPLKNDDGTSIVAPSIATIKADARFDTTYNDTSVGVGIYLDMNVGGSGGQNRHLAYRMVYTPEVAASIYPEITGLSESPSLSNIASKPSPFLTTVFGARMASKTHLAAKGFVQSSPLVNYTAMGGKDVVERTIQKHYGGTNHPVNSPFDYSFEKVAPAGDSLLPNEDDSSNRGYIVTGFTKADGLSRCVIAELPTRPLQSLVELQNWDIRYENPIPPFSFNIIGNSDASPLLPSNAVVNRSDARQSTNLQHDDPYCANHLLFDDWFFSSIAPDPITFGSGGSVKQTYQDFVTGTNPLGNRAYLPIQKDAAAAAGSTSNASKLYSDHVNTKDAWKTIASRLEVEGMFNVNSTSVVAWRALLGHARNQRVPYIAESGNSWSVGLSEKTDHAFSRFSIAGDVEAKESGSSGAYPEAAEFAGYRILDEKMLDSLAKEVVKQIRQRGPFLSLAEFINRQLSSGELALAGTLQAALNEIAKSPSTNPYQEIENVISRPALAQPASAGDAEYKFPEAAVGQSTYGLPGWTRQADVLRSIAPILTARDDTFTIRSYGDARDRNGDIKATAICEAVVRRTRDYVDPADAADITTLPTKSVNQTFGRRYEIVSFRWLAPNEI